MGESKLWSNYQLGAISPCPFNSQVSLKEKLAKIVSTGVSCYGMKPYFKISGRTWTGVWLGYKKKTRSERVYSSQKGEEH